MSHSTAQLRRILALLALFAVTSAPLALVSPGFASAAADPALDQAKAAVVAAKAAVERAEAAKEAASAAQIVVRGRLTRHTASMRKAADLARPAARAVRRSRERIMDARQAIKRAGSPGARKAARQRLLKLKAPARQSRAEYVKARKQLLAAQAAVTRANDAVARAQERLTAADAAIDAALAVLADARAYYAALVSGAASGVITAVANLPNRTSAANFTSSMSVLTASAPDFVTLNEISGRSPEQLLAAAPGYGVYRGGDALTEPGAPGQSISNAVLWRSDRYQVVAQGRIQVVNDDHGYIHGKRFMWDRYATWVTLRDLIDGRLTSVIATHMPTNPGKYPRQWGGQTMSRVDLYALGMDKLVTLTNDLARQGRVIVAGDMNSHPNQGAWTAAAKMAAAGYGVTKDAGVMYHFHSTTALVASTQQLRISSDHPALVTALQYPE